MKEKILIIVTGGLIIQEYDNLLGYVPQKDLSTIINTINSEVKMDLVELCEFSTVDSSAINLELMHSLAKLVQRKINMDIIRGIVIIAGSDTMEIMAYFLHRCIYYHLKPIVITGAMKHLDASDFDGKANLTNAIKQVANLESVMYGFGVTINFAGKIHSPVHVIKDHSFAVDPFTSGNYGLIGMMHTNRIDWRNKPKKSSVIPLPNKLASVPIVYAFPGAQEDLLDGFIGKHDGLVIVSYGSGNVSENMYLAMKRAIEGRLKLILVTNCKYGGVFSEYGGTGGNQSLKDLGVLMANDLNAYQAMVVGTLLFQNDHISKEVNLANYFSNTIRTN